MFECNSLTIIFVIFSPCWPWRFNINIWWDYKSKHKGWSLDFVAQSQPNTLLVELAQGLDHKTKIFARIVTNTKISKNKF
jgi:hypothetical protein